MSLSYETEKWRDVVGYEGLYIVSDMGRVMSLPRLIGRNGSTKNRYGKILTPRTCMNGYLKVTLYKDGVASQQNVHRLVMEAFVGKSDLQVNHIDEDKTNNQLDNLEYLSPLENSRYSNCKAVESYDLESGETVKQYASMRDVEADGHSSGRISSVCLNKRGCKSHHGLGWRFQKVVSG